MSRLLSSLDVVRGGLVNGILRSGVEMTDDCGHQAHGAQALFILFPGRVVQIISGQTKAIARGLMCHDPIRWPQPPYL